MKIYLEANKYNADCIEVEFGGEESDLATVQFYDTNGKNLGCSFVEATNIEAVLQILDLVMLGS